MINLEKTVMSRLVLSAALALAGFAAVTGVAQAGIPRGVMLSADEQTADETTGVTIARGNAELTVEKQPIRARADVIELRPKSNEILLKGRADVSVGSEHYMSDTVTCTLDFSRCLAVEPDQDLPDSPGGSVTSVSRGSATYLSPGSATSLSRATGTTNPR